VLSIYFELHFAVHLSCLFCVSWLTDLQCKNKRCLEEPYGVSLCHSGRSSRNPLERAGSLRNHTVSWGTLIWGTVWNRRSSRDPLKGGGSLRNLTVSWGTLALCGTVRTRCWFRVRASAGSGVGSTDELSKNRFAFPQAREPSQSQILCHCMQKPLNAIWNFLLKWPFLSSLYI